MTSSKRFGFALLALSLGGAFGQFSSATDSPDFSAIDRRVQELQPTAREKRFDEIGWAADIRSAIRLAKKQRRPVFLFTHDGRMNIGRC